MRDIDKTNMRNRGDLETALMIRSHGCSNPAQGTTVTLALISYVLKPSSPICMLHISLKTMVGTGATASTHVTNAPSIETLLASLPDSVV